VPDPTISQRLCRSIRFPYWSTGSALKMNDPGAIKPFESTLPVEKTSRPSLVVTVTSSQAWIMSRGPVGKSCPTLLEVTTAFSSAVSPGRTSSGAISSSVTAGPRVHLCSISGIGYSPLSHLFGQLDLLFPAGNLQQGRHELVGGQKSMAAVLAVLAVRL
jgi:hypothetical protein